MSASDLTVIVPGPHGEKRQLTFDETCTSDQVSTSVCKAIGLPAGDPYRTSIQKCVEETREDIREYGWKANFAIDLPTGKLGKWLGLPEQISPKIEFVGGERTIHRKYTKTTIQKQEKPEGSSQSENEAEQPSS